MTSDEGFVDQVAMEEDAPVLFDGDTGQLPLMTRRALALVLRSRYVAAADHPGEWRAILSDQDVLESRLHDLFLQLVVNRDDEIAYKTQVRTDGLSIPVLLKEEPYRRVETLMMVFLRGAYRQQRNAGERAAYVDADDLIEYALSFLAHGETNLAARRKEAENALATLVRERVLVEESEGRFRVLPIIEVLLPVDRIKELTRWLRAGGTEARGEGAGAADDALSGEDDSSGEDADTAADDENDTATDDDAEETRA
ncbi:DUF4194 domain-containing protein [Sanguibacter sp. A247]|uniref:DUF4194 domain-containing protein n=1 Tax=unclassified Sanguibacter TaxID=2645534 RepID=UPI003FD88073